MTPRRLLNSREVGEKLGLSNRAVTQRLGREAANIPEPDFWTDIPGRGRVYLWLPRRKDLQAHCSQHPTTRCCSSATQTGCPVTCSSARGSSPR